MADQDRMTAEELAEARARLARRTPGAWSTSPTGPAGAEWDAGMAIAATYGRQKIYARAGGSYPKADQEFIAAAPTDIARLLAEVDRLRAENTEVFAVALRGRDTLDLMGSTVFADRASAQDACDEENRALEHEVYEVRSLTVRR